jgi:hypothetical protein
MSHDRTILAEAGLGLEEDGKNSNQKGRPFDRPFPIQLD